MERDPRSQTWSFPRQGSSGKAFFCTHVLHQRTICIPTSSDGTNTAIIYYSPIHQPRGNVWEQETTV